MRRFVLLLAVECTSSSPDGSSSSSPDDSECRDSDRDDDGHEAVACGGDDCDDSDPSVHPGAPEMPGPDWTKSTVWSGGDLDSVFEVDAVADDAGAIHVVSRADMNPIYALGTDAGWQHEGLRPPDLGGAQSISISVDGDRRVYVAFGDSEFDRGPVRVASGVFGAWTFETADECSKPSGGTDVGVDAAGRIHVVYARSGCDASSQGLMHAVRGAGGWTVEEVESGWGLTGWGFDAHLALDGDTALIAYLLEGEVRLARSGPVGLETIPVATLVPADVRGSCRSLPGNGGPYVAVDGLGVAHLVFSDSRGVLHTEDGSGEWSDVEVVDQGAQPSATVDLEGTVHIAYLSGSAVSYARGRKGDWAIERIDGATCPVSLALDGSGWAHIALQYNYSYYDGGPSLVVATNRPSPDGVDQDCDGVDEAAE